MNLKHCYYIWNLNFANIQWHFLFFCCMWSIDLGFLYNIHLVLRLAYVLPFMENIQSLMNCLEGLISSCMIHNCGESMPRLIIHYVLWYHLVMSSNASIDYNVTTIKSIWNWWIQYKLHWMSFLWYKWWENMGSLGCSLPKYRC